MTVRGLCGAALGAAALAVLGWPLLAQQGRTAAPSEAAYRANNVGVAQLEQYDFAGAEMSFRRALALAPSLATARLNLGIALFYAGQPQRASAELTRARAALANQAQPNYVLGLIARAAGRSDEAKAAFLRARQLDPSDPGIEINIGQIDMEARRYPDAISAFRTALAAEPYNATAAYGLATALIRSGAADEGQTTMDRFTKLRDSPFAVTYSAAYLEQGRYAQAITSTGAEAALVDPQTPAVRFTLDYGLSFDSPGVGARSRTDGVAVTLADVDGDGDLDALDPAGGTVRLLRNDAGRLIGGSANAFGPAAPQNVVAIVPADADNDGDVDLLVLQQDSISVWRQVAPWQFTDAGPTAGLAIPGLRPRTAAWLDADHDGDLDLVVAGEGTPAVRVFQNRGDATFADVTAASKIEAPSPVVSLIPTDFDERRDVDVFVLSAAGGPRLFRNLREGSFEDVARASGLIVDGEATCAAAGDFNKDGYTDFVIGRRGAPAVLALSNGRAGFTSSVALPVTADAVAAQALDYDSDGLIDVVALTAQGLVVIRNLGTRWTDVSATAAPPGLKATAMASGDVNGDGLVDLVLRSESTLVMQRATGPTPVRSIRVQLQARVSNRSAVGAKVEVRAGSLLQKREVYAAYPAPAPADLVFGLGTRTGGDVARVLWPSGILQAETAPAAGAVTGRLDIQELDRKPSSCPYLFTWNGERFEFVTDFLGGGEMGSWVEPGVRTMPDTDEYVRIEGSRLRPKDGRYEIRVSNELEEALFLDRLHLVAISHPADVAVYPNEGLRGAPQPFKLSAVRDLAAPASATDEHGHDVRDRLARVDRQFVDDFRLEPVRGFAAEHTLTLGLPAGRAGAPRVLLLTGWTDYAFSSDTVAAWQRGLRMATPVLEIPEPGGTWRTVDADMGFPVGRPQTVLVDLAAVPDAVRQVRIRTNMRIYWDQAQVGTLDPAAPVRLTRLDPLTATLRWRGFSAEVSADGREPFTADYARVSTVMPWKSMPGRYTREGDVRDLLMQVDDEVIVSRTGDEIAVAFDASAVATAPAGWTTTFLLFGDGFSKEMNLHSGSPDVLEPLPYHRMPRYPYLPSEAPERSDAYRAYLERYNTRIVTRRIPSIDQPAPPTVKGSRQP